MFNLNIYYSLLIIFTILPIGVFYLLTIGKYVAPYGKMVSSSWGKIMIPAKWGWLIMESPSSILFVTFLVLSRSLNSGIVALFFIWQFHYFYRSFLYPFLTKHKNPMPLAMLLSSFIFQVVNTYFQAGWIFFIAPKDLYAGDYLRSWNFIIGLIIFLTGSFINRQSDFILKNLRKKGETDYKIPYGALFRYISCPNYLGEIIIWLGWMTMLKSWAGVAFVLWTIANLLPRALTSHQWYLKNFPDYPKDRKAIIPFIL
ncbi:MAG: DUF1295 domain-containing protein [Brevinema sp.]